MADKKIKLFVLDDEKDICRFVKMLFERRGFSVSYALSGQEAVKVARRNKPDIALIDIHLKKGINGVDALKLLREAVPACRCAIVTWDSAVEKIKAAKELGAVSYVTKPLTTAQLDRTVDKLVKGIKKRGQKHG